MFAIYAIKVPPVLLFGWFKFVSNGSNLGTFESHGIVGWKCGVPRYKPLFFLEVSRSVGRAVLCWWISLWFSAFLSSSIFIS